jgi:amino acid adenylation domain-containing protein/non-ribosomal peptide synthase protein (TIGR01720 family)
MKKVSGRLANLTPEQREKLLKKLREQKKELADGGTTNKNELAQTHVSDNDKILSFAQQRLWFLDRLEEQQATYNIPAILTINGHLDVTALQKSFAYLVQRHESFRTVFLEQDGKAFPHLLTESNFELKQSDLSACDDLEQQEQKLHVLAQREALKPFSLEKDSLLRAHLVHLNVRAGNERTALVICMHHIISDAWSMGVFVKEMSLAYNAYKENKTPDLSNELVRYVDFSVWQRKQFELNEYAKQAEYWKKALSDLDVLNLPVDKSRPAQQTYRGQQIKFTIPSSLSEKLRNISQAENKTLFMTLLAAWQVLLYRYSGQQDICIGTPVANRSHAQLESVIGFFVNTLAIRTELNPSDSFKHFLAKIQRSAVGAFANQDIPFEKIIDELGLERDMSQSPVFQNLFSFQNESVDQGINFSGLDIHLQSLHTQTAKFDLSLDIVNHQDELQGLFEFNTDLFNKSAIERMSLNFVALLESIALDTEKSVASLNCLDKNEYQLQLKIWNNTQTNFPDELSIVEQFEAQVTLSPNIEALKYNQDSYSYIDLNKKANQLARYLQKQGVKQGDFVGLCLERNINLIISILAVIKTGAAYLPIDPSYPAQRINLLISEGELSLLLTQNSVLKEKLTEAVLDENQKVMVLDAANQECAWQQELESNLEETISNEQLLYVIYTSGSTGVPKRTAATHRGESNLVNWYHKNSTEPNKNRQRYLLMSPLGFDLGQKNIFTPLLNGNTLVLPAMKAYDPSVLLETIKNNVITCLNCAPSAFYPLLLNEKSHESLASVRFLFLGGETIQAEKLLKWLNNSNCKLINSYGPSECTDIASSFQVDDINDFRNRNIPIGRPSQNTQLYLLDKNLQLAPIGTHAQLYIGGTGLGPGYLGQPDLTQEKIIKNPIAGEQGQLYSTGDIVRYSETGDVEYIGRTDNQIKIRGYRVEVSEIVSTILSFGMIADAAVCLKRQENGREYLAAYIVLSKKQDSFDALAFKNQLKQYLPDYMLPSAFVQIDQLPLTPNGKLDIKALPEPEFQTLSKIDYLAPKNQAEKTLQKIWENVLGISKVGVRDNFFELGGDSILSIQIISQARKNNIILSPSQIFRYPTISELVQIAGTEKAAVQAEQNQVKGEFELSPVQKWFFSTFEKTNSDDASVGEINHYNQSILLRLNKSISLDVLKNFVYALLTQHDAFNLQFVKTDTNWYQRHNADNVSFDFVDSLISAYAIKSGKKETLVNVLESAQQSLSLDAGRLIHFTIINDLKSGKEIQSLYIVAHHLVVDGISWRILLEDISTLFSDYAKSNDSNFSESSRQTNNILAEKTLSYKQWTSTLQSLTSTELLNEDSAYWIKTLEKIDKHREFMPELANINNNSDSDNNSGSYKYQKKIGFTIDKHLTDKFLKQANSAFRTDPNDLLLCSLLDGFISSVEKESNQRIVSPSLLIQLEGHGRELKDSIFDYLSMPDVSRTVGWFTTLYPVLLENKNSNADWGVKIKQLKEQLHTIPNKGLGYTLLGNKQESSEADIFKTQKNVQISFNYLGQFDAQLNSEYFSLDSTSSHTEIADGRSLDQSGALKLPFALDVLLFVSDGCLHCDFLYDSTKFSLHQIKEYLLAYQASFESLINYCCEQNRQYLTPSDLSAAILSQNEIESIEKHVYQADERSVKVQDEENIELETIHRLLPTQSGMLFHSIYSGDQGREDSYLEQFCVQLNGELNSVCLELAWQTIILKYANLRSIFNWQFKEPLQLVLKNVNFSIEHCQYLTSDDQKATLLEFLEQDKARGFDLACAPLMRVSLLSFGNEGNKAGSEKYWMVWSFHHILLDGWSVPLVLNDLFDYYEHYENLKYAAAETVGNKAAGSEAADNEAIETGIVRKSLTQNISTNVQQSLYRFEDYVAWFDEQDINEELFWKTELAGFSEANTIDLEPIALPMTEADRCSDPCAHLSLSKELSSSIKTFAKSHNLTLNSLVQGAWALLLSHYSGDDDVVFGSTVSGRSDEFSGVESIVGMFINTLPLRIKLSADLKLLDFLKAIQEKQQNIIQHQTSSLVNVQKLVGLESESSLFNSIIVFENFPVNERLKQKNTKFTVDDFYSFEKTNYPITISVEPNDCINFKLLFDEKIYRKETMNRLLCHLENILLDFPRKTHESIFNIKYISDTERKELDSWNKTETSYPRDANLIELVEQKVQQNPSHLALTFDEINLTYEALNKRANQLSCYLHNQGIEKGARVALFMDRSQELLISALAVIKTGAAYVPLDPAYPKERLCYMLEDCSPSLILTVEKNKQALEEALKPKDSKDFEKTNITNILYVDQSQEALENLSQENQNFCTNVGATDLAYLMYTSGSTGQPKGVCLSHRSIIRLVMNSWYLSMGPKDRVGHICNVCFDASAYEIWGALLNGATLVGFDRETILSEDLFAEKLQKESITNMLMTTSLFHLYSRHRPEIFSKLRCLLIGGEPLHPDAAKRVLNQSRPLHLMNVYGPTENGVLTTVFDTWNLADNAKNTPVGKPISNTTVYIVNKRDEEVPVGVVGELVSGGDGVGLGYWNLDEVTSRAFVRDPFSKEANARMYRTGDLARRLTDGSFEVLGRIDDQVKIRGFRIEPSEIVSRLNALDSVKDAVVVSIESEGHKKHLVGYLVAKEGIDIDLMNAKKSLSESLPAHMLPSFLIQIQNIPITPNGKLDKAKLPKPKFDEIYKDSYVAPRNEIERELVNIWSDVLKLGSIGIFDNFFELGGDSIISIQIVSRAKRAGLNISPKLLFEHPNVAELAQNVSKKNNTVVAEQGLVNGEIKLTPIQQWFFDLQLANIYHFNQSLLFDVEEFLTVQSITPIVSALLKQHDALRLRFEKSKGDWFQKHDNSARSLSSLADILSEQNFSKSNNPRESLLKHAATIQTQLNLEKGPLIKIVLYHLGKHGQKLLIIAHHIIMDGVSWRILIDDLNTALSQQSNNEAIDFGEKTSSYQFWSKIIYEYANSEYLLSHKLYWEQILSQAIENKQQLSLSEKIINVSNKKTEYAANKRARARLSLNLSNEKSLLLLRDCNLAYRTEVQDLLLLSLGQALRKEKICEKAWIDIEGHGRNILKGAFADQVDNSSTLGWFTSIYPVLMDIKGNSEYDLSDSDDMASMIKKLKSRLREIPDRGASFSLLKYINKDAQFESLIEAVPKPAISFNYLGQISEKQETLNLRLDNDYLGEDNSRENNLIYPINFSAAFKNESFEFSLLYDSTLIDARHAKKILKQFSTELDALIEHCMNAQNFGFTPSDLPYYPIEQNQLDHICDLYKTTDQNVAPVRLNAIYPLSPMQEGMLFHSRLDKSSGMYCEQVSVLFSGEMNVQAMQQAWNDALASHDVLRTSFVWEDLPKPLQLVHAKACIEIQTLDWSDKDNIDALLQRFLKEDRAQGFDFSQAPLMRLYYIKWPRQNLYANAGRFIWTYHHILLDGWSMPLLMKEVFDRYNLNIKNDDISDQSIVHQKPFFQKESTRYENYIEWLYTRGTSLNRHNEVLENNRNSSEQFWLSYLAGFEEPNSLGISKRKQAALVEGLQYQEVNASLTEQQTQDLQALAACHQVTLNTILQAAWAILLNRYSGEQDIVFGITVSGRPSELSNIETIIGLFINTVPFRVQVDAEAKLDDWLKSILKNQVQLRQFETTPLVDIQTQSHIDGTRALFDSILVFENYPLDETLSNAPEGLKVENLQVYEQTNFPLSLIILPGKRLDIRMLFDTQSFEHNTISQVLKHLKTILLEFCLIKDAYQTELQHISYLSEAERKLITEEWNNTDSEYPRNDYLQDIVAKQNSEKTALISEQGEITFEELNTKANQLAAYISSDVQGECQVKPNDKVVVCLNRSADLIISILAILKAGASYVPLDPGYPEERQRYMLEDTQTKLIITDSENASLVKHLSSTKAFRNSINFVDINAKQVEISSMPNNVLKKLVPYINNQETPAAILYTSGSTGQPKGVCLTHKGLSRMVLNTNYMHVSDTDRVAHVSNICFDAASFEIWAALLNGIPLVILEKDIMLDLKKFEQQLKAQQVSVLLITTALFNLVAKEQVNALSNINYLFFGGEACNAEMVKRVLYKAQPKHLMHMYGPSENATYATWYEVKAIPDNAKSIPIGKAVSNSQVYIMNQQGDLLPPGVAGEIVCAGDGLALGYLNKIEQTQKAFVYRSLPNREPEPMYLTGDLGVCLPDGNIEILGRIDNQVKIRGHRIEPEEIIARINALAEVKKAYVLVKNDLEDRKFLIAYFVPEQSWIDQQDDKLSRARELKLKLKSLMPDYMVPSFYVEIDELPLTPNGKIDTKALPDTGVMQSSSDYQEAESALEKALVEIWQEVLQHEKVGVHDDFFELGGHSLLATQVHSRIRQQLSIDIPLRTLFELPTISEFSEFWEAISASQQLHDVHNESAEEDDFEEGEL